MKYPLQAFMENAVYTIPGPALYRDNPLIEALPENPDDRELYSALIEKVPYDPEDRNLPIYERIELIHTLGKVHIPVSSNAMIVRNIFSAIRMGYVGRNPFSFQMKDRLIQTQSCIRDRDPNFRCIPSSNGNANGFSIIGDSGLGKSRSFERALNFFPQILIHSEYHGREFNHMQLVWMKLECPHDGSVKGLCSAFFLEFDRLTGDNTLAKYAAGGRATTDQMIPQMALISQRHSLGLLVIDEIQNISSAKSGGAEKLLKFLIQLVNTIGIPILLVGTPEAESCLTMTLQSARRTAGQQGAVRLRPLELESDDWKSFIRGIWKYQWTKTTVPLTEEFKSVLHKISYGNLYAAMVVYKEAQKIAIIGEQCGEDGTLKIEHFYRAEQSDAFKAVLKHLGLEEKWRCEKEQSIKKTEKKRIRTPIEKMQGTNQNIRTSKRKNKTADEIETELDLDSLIVKEHEHF